MVTTSFMMRWVIICTIFSPVTQQPLVGEGLLIIEASRPHSNAPNSVGLLWTSDQPDANTSTWEHTTLTRDRHPCHLAGFEPTIPASERPQIYASDGAATGIGNLYSLSNIISVVKPRVEMGVACDLYGRLEMLTKCGRTSLRDGQLGRYRRRWKDNIRRDLKETQREDVCWVYVTRPRIQWQVDAHSLNKFRVLLTVIQFLYLLVVQLPATLIVRSILWLVYEQPRTRVSIHGQGNIFIFFLSKRTDRLWAHTHPPIKWVRAALSSRVKQPKHKTRKLTAHLHLGQKLRLNRAPQPLNDSLLERQSACRGFFSILSVKKFVSPLFHCTGRLRVRFPVVPLEFFVDIILSVALWTWGRLSF
jgi:hypothetical protein